MQWLICLIISVFSFSASVVFSAVVLKRDYKSGKFGDPLKILFVGVVVTSVVMFLPIYTNSFIDTDAGIFETVLISIHNTIRLFIVDGEFEFIITNLADVSSTINKWYTIMFSILFVEAPLLTFGFVLSFFKKLSATKHYITHYNSDIYVFSKLNEKSFALAKSLYCGNKKRFFIFTGVSPDDEKESDSELLERVRKIGAICYSDNIVTLNFSFHSKKSKLNLFAMEEDQCDNISQALKLVEKFKYRENTNLYVFSTQPETEMLLSGSLNVEESVGNGASAVKIRIRCVNEVQSLIMRLLYDDGYEKIFKSALDCENGIKQINAVVVGMGKYGTEMTKALAWFCQMDGYLPHIHSFDSETMLGQTFTSECPELMKFSGKLDIKGETRYTIDLHSGVDVGTVAFEDALNSLGEVSYAFVALGTDEKNIFTAIKLRTLFERMGQKPIIQAVVYNTDTKEALNAVTNYNKKKYDIDFVGDIESFYSEQVILKSDLEDEALKRHSKWGNEADFWRYNYYYKSSIASVIHKKMKTLCKIPGIDKEPRKRTYEELWGLRILEHRRWNAYMRSEGYVFGGTVDPIGRNDLAKMHNFLVPFDELPLSTQINDDD